MKAEHQCGTSSFHEAEDSMEFTRNLIDTFALPFKLNNNVIYTTLSIGITVFPDDALDPDDLIRNAGMALYRAKQAGKNTYYPYTSALMEAAVWRLTGKSYRCITSRN
ncbi:MAG: diguanylate cyclase domain-containing protein [Spirochaetia bacterium]